jgi:hypothetical protein
MEDIKSNAMAELRKIPKEAFCRCLQQQEDWWNECVFVCTQKGIKWGLPYILPL